ncbi:hypothetical protein EFJ98_12990 [Pseudomonas putida]|nr:hypothetical protein EFJ98_12990 [Pseudomonas putida]
MSNDDVVMTWQLIRIIGIPQHKPSNILTDIVVQLRQTLPFTLTSMTASAATHAWQLAVAVTNKSGDSSKTIGIL